MLLSLLLLASLLGSLALEDLERNAFVFPEASNTARAVLKPTIQHPLTSFTLCMRFYTELNRAYSLFSYASKRSDNEILFISDQPNEYTLNLGSQAVVFKIPEKFRNNPGREHICVSWESATGLVELWMNGQPFVRKSLRKGHSVSAEASIILGQDQDNFGGGFEINQSFVGEITDVYLWDRVLCPDEVALAWHNHIPPGYLINWRSLSYDMVGYAFVKPTLLSVHRAG